MSVLTQTQLEVEELVNVGHADIINQFLAQIDKPAVKKCECGWPGRELQFKRWLFEYIDCKLAVHRQRRGGWEALPTMLVDRITCARNHVRELAPCPTCIALFNPTNRRRSQTWNPKRNRAWRELLT